MTLTMSELSSLREEALADDVPIPPEAISWTREQATEYFESGGVKPSPVTPTPPTPPTPTPAKNAIYEVVHAYVNMRSEPLTTAKSVGTKSKGARLEVLEERQGWVRLAERSASGTEA